MFGAACYWLDLKMVSAAATSIRLGQEESTNAEARHVWKPLKIFQRSSIPTSFGPNFPYADELV